VDSANDPHPERRSIPRLLVRFGIVLGAMVLALGIAPGLASAQTTSAVQGKAVAAVQVAAAVQGPTAGVVQPALTDVVYQIRCFSCGCDVSFTTTPRYDRARLWVGCSRGSGVYSATWFGPGSGYLSSSCAAYGLGSPTQYLFSYWNSDPWYCTRFPRPSGC